MRNIFRVLLVAVVFVACSKSAVVPSADGLYSFDAEVFVQNLSKSEDPIFKNMPKDFLDKTMAGLKTFTIEIKGSEATANFSTVVVKASLKKLDTTDGSVRFLMTPVDEDKKNDVATLIVEGNKLTLDPGKGQVDKLYFRKIS